ncbi:MAG: CoA transferase [Rhodobacteraceae bacterium]|nr:CoA transferase [Paracoccaceae bacterium]
MPDSPPLKGLKILEFAGIGPAPYAGQLLSDLGAELWVIDRPNRGTIAREQAVDRRGKRSIVIDLKKPDGVALAARLAARADVLIEGLRPGVMERLGLGPELLCAQNPRLVYARMTGWGQNGPMAGQAGHDINYLSLTGALHAMGTADRVPPPPLNLVGDYGGGSMFLIMGILAALYGARASGRGQVVDAAIVDGVNSMMGMFHGLRANGDWSGARQSNWLDGGMPYYRCYRCSDGRFMAVGCIEPVFFARMLALLGLDAADFGPQNDPAQHGAQMVQLEVVFASKTMAAWQDIFAGSDACVTPVLTMEEVATHPHMAARAALKPIHGMQHPAVAPRFTPPITPPETMPVDGENTIEILEELGVKNIKALLANGAVRQA